MPNCVFKRTAEDMLGSSGPLSVSILRIRTSAPPHPEVYPVLVMIYWEYENDASGLPANNVRERMERFEDLLVERVERLGVALHTATSTGNGLRDWQWYARSADEMMQALNLALSDEHPFPIQISSEPDPGWRAYSALLSKAK